MKYYLYIITLLTFSCGTNNSVDKKITESNNEGAESIATTTEIKIQKKNEFWSSLDIASVTLYCYFPEANYELGYAIMDSTGQLHPTVI
ncbi:MAG: hypothetical protein ACI86P_002630, partial [Flavobacteriales bacterium]